MSAIVDDAVSVDEHVGLGESSLRKRHPWNPLGSDSMDLLADVDELDDEEEEDGVGCPLPSTPEDNQLLEAEVRILLLILIRLLLLLLRYHMCMYSMR